MDESVGTSRSLKKGSRKKRNTANLGHTYDNLLKALFAIDLSQDKKVTDFKFSSNNRKFGKLNDIVIEVTRGRRKKHYVIQTKHRSKEKKINTSMLAAEEGDFSVHEYFQCYKEIKNEGHPEGDYNCILYTNLKCEMQDGIKFRIDSLKIELKVCKIQIEDKFLSSTDIKFAYKFKVSEEAEDEYRNFFDHFFLYPNQKNLESVRSFVWEKLCREDCFTTFLNYINEKEELDKENVKMKMGEILLKSSLSVSSNDAPELNLRKLLDTCLLYDVTIMTTKLNFKSFNKICNESGKKISKIRNEYRIVAETIEDETALVLWHLKKIPLVIRVDENNKEAIYSALKLFDEEIPKRKFLLIGENIDRSRFDKLRVFQNLNDLRSNEEIYEEITSTTRLCLQGREPVAIKSLTEEDITKIITVDELFRSPDISIGEAKEDLPLPYIHQTLTKIIIHDDFLNDLSIQSVVVLSCRKNEEEVKSKIRNAQAATLEEVLHEDHEKANFFYSRMIIFVEDCTEEQFESICDKCRPSTCHLFAIDGKLKLDWIRSNSTIVEIRKHMIRTEIEESALFENSNKRINIISAKPGAGKTVMLKFLKNTISPDYWVVYIKFRDHEEFFGKKSEKRVDLVEYFLNFQRDQMGYNSFELRVRDWYKNHHRIVFLWDAMDELSRTCYQEAITTVQKSANLGFINWVTSRDFLQSNLEKAFETFAINIEDANQQKQEDYIEKLLQNKHEPEELSMIVTQITTVANQEAGFLGSPLQIFMLTDLFLKNPEKYKDLINGTVTLPEYIQYFMSEQFNFSDKSKAGYPFGDFITEALEGKTRHRSLQYEVLALKALLPDEVFKTLGINCKHILYDFEDSRDSGIVTGIDRERFVHKVYAEYFVATWMSNNLQQVKNFNEFIFGEYYNNVRLLFDLILARDCPAHIAVLHRSFKNLFDHREHIGLKDPAGRTPLHLACSWGCRHFQIISDKIGDYYVLKDKKTDFIDEDIDSYKIIVEFLVSASKLDPFVKEELYDLTPVEYSESTLSLLAIDIILKEFPDLELENLRNFNDLVSTCYYSIRLNYERIFNRMKKIEYVVFGSNGNNFLHCAVTYERNNFLDKIFANAKYVEEINGTSSRALDSGETPLHHAVYVENCEAIPKLLEKGAVIDCPDFHGKTPLHIASMCGFWSTMKVLLKKGASVNYKTKHNETPIHFVTMLHELHTIRLILQQKPRFYKNFYDHTAFDIAAIRERPDILEMLMKETLSCSDTKKQNYFFGPLMHSARSGQYDIVKCFVDNGVNINWSNRKKETPIHIASSSGQTRIVEFLLRSGADLNLKTSYKWNSLNFAVWGKHIKTLKLLLENGADTSNCDGCGNSILSAGVVTNNIEVIETLLDNGADVNHKDESGHCVLDFAAAFGTIEVINLLLQRKADVSSRDSQGISPLHWAVYHHRKEIVALLLRHGGDLSASTTFGITPLMLLKQPHLERVFGKLASFLKIVGFVDDKNVKSQIINPQNFFEL